MRPIQSTYHDPGEPEVIARYTVDCIKAIANDIGDLDSINFYADWTGHLSPVTRVLNSETKCNIIMVPRKASNNADRCDTTIVADIIDLTHTRSVGRRSILLCAGDADYVIAARRATERGFDVHVASLSVSISAELTNLAHTLYPLDKRILDAAHNIGRTLVPRVTDMPSKADIRRWAGFIRLLDQLSARLPYVVRAYCARLLTQRKDRYGADLASAHSTINQARELGIINIIGPFPDPTTSRNEVFHLELNDSSPIVICVLNNIKVSDPEEPDPDT